MSGRGGRFTSKEGIMENNIPWFGYDFSGDHTLTSGAEDGGQNPNPEPGGADSGADTITISKVELEKQKQQEADRRVTEALKKKESEFAKKLEDLEKKFEKQKMTEEERKKTEEAERIKALEEREKEVKKKELDLETTKLIAEKRLPTELLGTIEEITDLDKRKTLLENFETLLKTEVDKRIKEMEKGTFTSGSNGMLDVSKYVPKKSKSVFDAVRENLK